MTFFPKRQLKVLLKIAKSAILAKTINWLQTCFAGNALGLPQTEIDNEQPTLALVSAISPSGARLGNFRLSALIELQTGDGFAIECDPSLKAKHPIRFYANTASYFQSITTGEIEPQQQLCFYFKSHNKPCNAVLFHLILINNQRANSFSRFKNNLFYSSDHFLHEQITLYCHAD